MGVTFEMTPELMELIAKEAGAQIAERTKVDAREIYDPLVGIEEALDFLDCSRSYLDSYYMHQDGFPFHQKGGQRQFRLSELSKFLDKTKLEA